MRWEEPSAEEAARIDALPDDEWLAWFRATQVPYLVETARTLGIDPAELLMVILGAEL